MYILLTRMWGGGTKEMGCHILQLGIPHFFYTEDISQNDTLISISFNKMAEKEGISQ